MMVIEYKVIVNDFEKGGIRERTGFITFDKENLFHIAKILEESKDILNFKVFENRNNEVKPSEFNYSSSFFSKWL